MSKDDTTITIEGSDGQSATMTGGQLDKVADRLTGGPEIPVQLKAAVIGEDKRVLEDWLNAIRARRERVDELYEKSVKAIDSYLEKHLQAKRDVRMFGDIAEQLDEQRRIIERELDNRPFELEG